MPESDDNLHLEIGHVLFIDIVGYSRLGVEGMGVDGANDEGLAELLSEMDGLGMLISSCCSRRREQREKIRAATQQYFDRSSGTWVQWRCQLS